MTNDDYKKYSLENLSKWFQDAISSAGATPEEIYNIIKEVVEEEHTFHQEGLKKSSDLLSLLNGSTLTINDVLCERDYYKSPSTITFKSCSSEDTSPECMTSWGSFWNDDKLNFGLEEVEDFSYVSEDGDVWGNDKVNKWRLPVEVDGLTGDCFIQLPDDLLGEANLKEGDQVEWIDRKDGSFELRKVNGTK